ncbi:MAG: hypothetical protein HDR03_15360 [Lachnospiraceae bacterium]|nr:hypothetical protein [Lachnospiraceae bacterium]
MMYIHYCKRCHRIHMLNGHKRSCPNCNESITELKMPYMEYISLDRDKRSVFLERLADDAQLKDLSTTYRMYKYSKWYKELHMQLPGSTIITYTLTDEHKMDNAVSTLS